MEPIKIIIVDDEPIIRKALKNELNSQPATIACGMNDDGDIEYRSVTVLDTYANGAQLMAALDSPADHQMPTTSFSTWNSKANPQEAFSLPTVSTANTPTLK